MATITKFFVKFILISAILQIAFANHISKEFTKNELVPEILDRAPLSKLPVKFCGDNVGLGEHFTPNHTKSQPEVGSWCEDSDKYYALIMFDPDAPSRSNPTLRSVLHWYVGNIPGNRVSKGQVLGGYNGPEPPKDTGYHRYAIVVFEQLSGRVQYPDSYFDDNEVGFSVKDAVRKFNLSSRPVAGTFFEAKFQ